MVGNDFRSYTRHMSKPVFLSESKNLPPNRQKLCFIQGDMVKVAHRII